MELPSIRFSAAGTPDSVPEHFVGLPVIGIQFLQKISQSSIWDFFTMWATNFHTCQTKIWFQPVQKSKKSVTQSLLHCSYEICSFYQLIHKEFPNIKFCFLSSGYPDWLIDKQMKIFLNKRYGNTPKNKQERMKNSLPTLAWWNIYTTRKIAKLFSKIFERTCSSVSDS